LPRQLTRQRQYFCGLAAAVLVALGGCTQPATGPQTISAYLSRLSDSLDTPVPAGRVPSPRRLNQSPPGALPIDDNQLNLIDFLSLGGCALQVNIGRRNSHLGRHASASQRLILDIEFLQLAPDCIAHLQRHGEPELAQTLALAMRHKQETLASRIYNAVIAGEEWQRFWQIPAAIGSWPTDTDAALIDSLWQLSHWIGLILEGRWPNDPQQLETYLGDLRRGDGGTALLAVWRELDGLDQANRLLLAGAEARPLCPFGQDTPRAQHLHAVVRRYFATDLQSWLVQVRNRSEGLAAPIRHIERQLSEALPTSYQRWVRERDELLGQVIDAPRDHVLTVQQVLSQCVSTQTDQIDSA
jgi:hypothetical protein